MNKFNPHSTIKAKDLEHLKSLIRQEIEKQGCGANLNHIDVSNVRAFNELFSFKSGFCEFNGDISKWDVSGAEDMTFMFMRSQFNGDLSKWDVSKVKTMFGMFSHSQFNGDISKWDVSCVQWMTGMFGNSQFNQGLSSWNIEKVVDMAGMFLKSSFNQDISQWDVSRIKSMDGMFQGSEFCQDLSNWALSSLKVYPDSDIFLCSKKAKEMGMENPTWQEVQAFDRSKKWARSLEQELVHSSRPSAGRFRL